VKPISLKSLSLFADVGEGDNESVLKASCLGLLGIELDNEGLAADRRK
jgi:hypothetical protein